MTAHDALRAMLRLTKELEDDLVRQAQSHSAGPEEVPLDLALGAAGFKVHELYQKLQAVYAQWRRNRDTP